MARGKWIRGNLENGTSFQLSPLFSVATYGTRLVWNSFKSTFRDPSKRKDAVIEETTCAISLFKLVNPGDEMPKFFLQMS